MCGICGILNHYQANDVEPELLRTMAAMLAHRGPDEAGFYRDERIALGHTRLSIIDLAGGSQPLCNEDRTLWIVFNGEIFNYLELRKELEAAGHVFRTNSDTETIVHAYEEYGADCLQRFNGQFAFALWDSQERQLFLARDRLGIRPLYYWTGGGRLIFASEVKSIAAHPDVHLEVDPLAIDEVFTFWSTVTGRSAFRSISEIPPGHYMFVKNGELKLQKYWELRFPDVCSDTAGSEDYYAEQLREQLIQSARLRLRADVPVGAYLSGGLDSSIITTIIRNHTDAPLITFSIRFEDAQYDEGPYQDELIKHLGTKHSRVECTREDIARAFPDMIWHAEKPVLRTAPVPLLLLSKLVRDSGMKVVLTGEGADEFLGGYNIFKEAKIRRFWARNPNSAWRPLLLQKLYPYLAQSSQRSSYYWQSFFQANLTDTDLPYYSHVLRWNNTSKIKTMFSQEVKTDIGDRNAVAEYASTLSSLRGWDCLSQAQYIEIDTFLSNYLLSSQGDRVAMANSVEGRFPFLDHNVVEFCNQIPSRYKLNGLNEKYILKKSMAKEIPPAILKRAKQPYRAPDSACFFGKQSPEYVHDLLSERELKQAELFDVKTVSRLVGKMSRFSDRPASARDDMAIVGIISTQLLHHHFVSDFHSRFAAARAAAEKLNVRVDEVSAGMHAAALNK